MPEILEKTSIKEIKKCSRAAVETWLEDRALKEVIGIQDNEIKSLRSQNEWLREERERLLQELDRERAKKREGSND
jgi:hypothetical protein